MKITIRLQSRNFTAPTKKDAISKLHDMGYFDSIQFKTSEGASFTGFSHLINKNKVLINFEKHRRKQGVSAHWRVMVTGISDELISALPKGTKIIQSHRFVKILQPR